MEELKLRKQELNKMLLVSLKEVEKIRCAIEETDSDILQLKVKDQEIPQFKGTNKQLKDIFEDFANIFNPKNYKL